MATIELTNNVVIDSNSLKTGIDTNNLLASGTNIDVDGYTATEDCWIIQTVQGYSTNYYTFYIDGNSLGRHGSADNGLKPIVYYVKKGQTFSWTNSVSGWSGGLKDYFIYGIK